MGDLLARGIRGRPNGRRNQHTLKMREHVERLIEKGVSPLEYLLGVMRAEPPTKNDGEEWADFYSRWRSDTELRMDAARIAMPYVHPKIAENTRVTLETSDSGDREIDVLELAKRVAFLFRMSAEKQKLIN